ncbi:hypothetical protein [Thiohalophilus sp.]|uniref:hypothetical protein n=1 Tax=Thiohalophilus sp. TaxID=3028392 RepID=UPI002ACEB8E4|nr:hypothetical protein [Thiohalophilus sp.]MDZ7805203.1 hypothetical protein [Thiohalophilus sp.]
MPRFFLMFPLLGVLGACQAPPFSPDSPLTAVPVQSTLILHEPLNLPSETVSLWFQNGRQQPESNLDRYYPHCKFETLRMQDNPKTVQPDTFVIHKVVRWDDYAMQSVQLAASRFISGLVVGDSDGGPSHVNTTTEMFLRSGRQPDVYRLICSQWEDAAEANHVTINQIRRVLGDTFTLKLPEERSLNPDGS